MSNRDFGEGEGLTEWSGRIQSIMDEMLNRNFVSFRDCGTWQPATNVYERREAYFLCIELAGMDEESIDVHCTTPTRVVIDGARAQPRPAEVSGPLSVHVMEIDQGPFRRIIDLPEAVDVDAVEASYSKGFLWITLPKANQP
jgi:HSP20 family protein